MDSEYADSRWAQSADEQVFLWKVAGQGYEGLSIYLVLSAFLTTWANVAAQTAQPAALGEPHCVNGHRGGGGGGEGGGGGGGVACESRVCGSGAPWRTHVHGCLFDACEATMPI